MTTKFYRAFEDKFRGSRELIMSRLQVYRPFIEPLKEIHPDASAVDLGCGRGEWLEVLGSLGFSAQGVDLDEDMLAACREHDLNVQATEAISFLKSLTDESQTIISGFHLAEHISFSDLQDLVKEALRVLRPAGILILETPNPENIVVGTSEFYLDPTHQRPIPPKLLSFLPDYYGFKNVKIIRLQEPENLGGSEAASVSSVLWGVSRDYAVIAQKNAKEKLINLLQEPFRTEYGVTLDQLTSIFDRHIHKMNVRAQLADERAQLADERAQLADERAQVANERIKQREDLLLNIYNSRSWRITAPMRWAWHQTEQLGQDKLTPEPKAHKRPGSRLRSLLLLPVRIMLKWSIGLLARYPQLKTTLVQKLGISAELEYRLYKTACDYGLVVGTHGSEANHIIGQASESSDALDSRITSVDYFDLKISQRVCDVYGLNIDFELIRKIRRDLTLPYDQCSAEDLEKAIVHIYLALLYRHPSARDTAQLVKKIHSDNSFDTLFSQILKAPEFEGRGFRGLA